MRVIHQACQAGTVGTNTAQRFIDILFEKHEPVGTGVPATDAKPVIDGERTLKIVPVVAKRTFDTTPLLSEMGPVSRHESYK